MKTIKIRFEDQGQDMLWWEVDIETEVIVACGAHESIYKGDHVLEPLALVLGECVGFMHTTDGLEQRFKVLKFPIVSLAFHEKDGEADEDEDEDGEETPNTHANAPSHTSDDGRFELLERIIDPAGCIHIQGGRYKVVGGTPGEQITIKSDNKTWEMWGEIDRKVRHEIQPVESLKMAIRWGNHD